MKVYALGHGFVNTAFKTKLVCDMVTHVKEGTMLDGRGLANLVDTGNYNVVDANVTLEETHPKNKEVNEHYLCSDMSTMRDVIGTAAWKGRDAKKAWVELPKNLGKVITLSDSLTLYTTKYNYLTKLSSLQTAIGDALGAGKAFTLHWSACRTYVEGDGEALIAACSSSLSEPTDLV